MSELAKLYSGHYRSASIIMIALPSLILTFLKVKLINYCSTRNYCDFLPRDAMLARYTLWLYARLSVCLYVCLTVTTRRSTKQLNIGSHKTTLLCDS